MYRKIQRSLLGSLSGAKGDFEDFRAALNHRECASGYGCDNHLNSKCCWGAFQFSQDRLNELQNKYHLTPWVSKQNFINNPSLQDEYFDQHATDLAAQLQPVLAAAQARYGSDITISGLVGGGHIAGAGGARSWANGGRDRCDSNGTCISDYVNEFSGYDIPGYDESTVIVDDGTPPDQPAQQAIPSGLFWAAAIGALLAIAGG